MIIAIDFDGTCVTHDFPNVGKDIGAVPVLKKLVASGHELILWTMRSDSEGKEYLKDACSWFEKHNIPLHGANINHDQKSWTSSPKAYAHLYIDDAALGISLHFNQVVHQRPFVNWDLTEKWLILHGWIKEPWQVKIDNLSHTEICRAWRFHTLSDEYFQGEKGEYLKDRLFKHFGGFTPEISKSIGWEL